MNKQEIVPYKTLEFHKNMVAALAKPERDIICGLIKQDGAAHALHMAVGISGEMGELLENICDGLGRENRVEELGDLEFYMRGLAEEIGYNSLLLIHNVLPSSNTLQSAGMYASIKASQLLDAVKKYCIYEKEVDAVKVAEAFTGLLYCLESIRLTSDITRQECLEHNIAKLGKRYSGGTYTNQDAQVRADKPEGH